MTAETDMIVGRTAWFFVAGDQPSELHRLERLIGVLITVHALRQQGFAIESVCMFQLITGLTLNLPLGDWSTGSLLTSFVHARAMHGS